jgi:RNA polymerase sigma-70 factor (ECF subfamily)
LSNTNTHHKDTDKKICALLRNQATAEKGFRLLVQLYQERLYWQINKIVKDHDDTDEVLQNTFLKVYRGFKNFRAEAQLYTWIYRIATNESFSFLKKKYKSQTLALDDTENGIANQLESSSYFDGNAAEILLQKALETLPEKQREVFLLRYYDEMTYKEISNLLGTSVGGLKASYHHAVKKIETFVKASM